MNERILTANVLLLMLFCVFSCNASEKNSMMVNNITAVPQEVPYHMMKLVYDKEQGLLIIENNESGRVVSGIRLQKNNDTLALEIKSALVFRRTAVTSAVKLPSDVKFIKMDETILPLSRIRKLDSNDLQPVVIFQPKHFPFEGKINCSYR